MLSAARTRLRRLSPDEAYDAAARAEAILVDIRPEGQRAIEGGIAGTLAATRVMEIGLYLPSFVGCQRSSRKSSCAGWDTMRCPKCGVDFIPVPKGKWSQLGGSPGG